MRFRKGRDPLQHEVWERNKAVMLDFLYEHINEEFNVRYLSRVLHLSHPTVRRHLLFLERARIVMNDYTKRPAKFSLRPFWPMSEALVEKTKQTLRYALPSSPPDSIRLTLSENKLTKTEVTVLRRGTEYSRQYTLTVKEALRISEASRQQ
jgi:hypothetical protein